VEDKCGSRDKGFLTTWERTENISRTVNGGFKMLEKKQFVILRDMLENYLQFEDDVQTGINACMVRSNDGQVTGGNVHEAHYRP
jgi:hypothetical protein